MFNDVVQAMLFQIELNLVTITVLAPNLPLFFAKTSTGGVYFLPGEALGGSKSGTKTSNTYPSKGNSYALADKVRWSTRGDRVDLTGKGDDIITSTAVRGGEGGRGKRASFDSDVILVRRSVDVEATSDGDNSDHQTTVGRGGHHRTSS